MSQYVLPTTAGDLGALFGAEVLGDPASEVSRLAPLSNAGKGVLSFFAHSRYLNDLLTVKGAVVLTRRELVRDSVSATFLVVEDPQASFAKIANQYRPAFPWSGVSPLAIIHPSAQIDPTVQIAPHVMIGEGTKIGARTCIHPYTFIGRGITIGEDCEIHVRVTLLDGIQIGNRVQIFTGSILGSDGFGYFRPSDQGPYTYMPQVGSVVVEDDVRMGALCTVDRGTLGPTRVGRGTKMDDHVHVGHNAQIGQDNILCGQAGVGGSSVLEDNVVLGGQSGVGPAVRIRSGARLGDRTGALTNVPGNQTYMLTPHVPVQEFIKIWRQFRRLPELARRVKMLEEKKGGSSDG